MGGRRAGLLACLLLACARGPAPAPGGAAGAISEATAPASPERQRFEAWKQEAVATDPRQEFARRAEAEAEQRRREALARGGQTGTPLEREMREDQLALLAAGRAGCFEEEPDLTAQDDWIRHRDLSRADFQAPDPSAVGEPGVFLPRDELGAYVTVRLACVVKGRLSEPEPGSFRVEIDHVKYLALLSRQASWWNPSAAMPEAWVLRHEQLHFDVAELIAQELTTRAPALHAELVGHGADPSAAIADFQRRWVEHLAEQQRRFVEIEQRYDLETRHGSDPERQTEWFARVRRGLGAVRAGVDTPPVLVQ